MMEQDVFTLLTKIPVNYSDEDWSILVNIAGMRLASFLCLEELPEFTSDNADLEMLFANFIAAMLKFQGSSDTIESKRVRNFTINFKSSATNAFEQIGDQYGDIIEKYSNCDLGIDVERSARKCCQRGYLNL